MDEESEQIGEYNLGQRDSLQVRPLILYIPAIRVPQQSLQTSFSDTRGRLLNFWTLPREYDFFEYAPSDWYGGIPW